MNAVPSRVAVPFLLALVGVLFIVGTLLHRATGVVGVAVYLVLLVAGVVAAGLLARRSNRSAELTAGRTCTCCTSTVHDPVKVI